MAFWTVIGTGKEVHTGKTFGLTLDQSNNTWQAGGPSVDLFFKTKSGRFAVVGIPENGTQLVGADGKEVAFIKALNMASAVGATGTGRASEKGVNFDWKLDSK